MSLMGNMSSYDENEQGGFSLLRDGDYPMAMLEWSQEATKDGSGRFLKLALVVIDGPDKDSKMFQNYMTEHSNPTVVKISGAALKKLVISCGFDGNQILTEELMNACIGKSIVGRVGTSKPKPDSQYGPSNEIKKFMSNTEFQKVFESGKAMIPGQTPAPAAGGGKLASAPAPQATASAQAPVQQAPTQQAPAMAGATATPAAPAPAGVQPAAATSPWAQQQAG